MAKVQALTNVLSSSVLLKSEATATNRFIGLLRVYLSTSAGARDLGLY